MKQTAKDDPVVMVSGASRGIGLAIAKELLNAGWRVSAGTRKPVTELENMPADRYVWSAFDAHDPATEKQWVTVTQQALGRIDAIVHNAGVLSHSSVIDAADAKFDELFEVNVKSPMRLTQCVWPWLQEADQGKVVVIASLAGKRVREANAGLYSMSKAAALSLAHGIRHAGEPFGIRCTAICPGFVATDMAEGVDASIQEQLTQPAEIARITRLVLELQTSSSIAEIPINWHVESIF